MMGARVNHGSIESLEGFGTADPNFHVAVSLGGTKGTVGVRQNEGLLPTRAVKM